MAMPATKQRNWDGPSSNVFEPGEGGSDPSIQGTSERLPGSTNVILQDW